MADSGNIIDIKLGNYVIVKAYKGSDVIFNQATLSGAKGSPRGKKKKEIHVVTDVYTPKDDEGLRK